MRGGRTFTTYMNIEPGKGNARALSTFEQQAENSLKRVANTARQAGATATGSVTGSNNSAAIRQVALAERSRADAIQRTARVQREADAAARRVAGSYLAESTAARAAAGSTSKLERSLRLAAVAANVAQGPLGPIAGRLSAMATAIKELTGIRLGIVGAGAAAAQYIRMASSVQDLVARLRPLYDNQTQVNAAFADAEGIANRARVAIAPVVDLYARLTLAGRDVGLSQARISRLTEVAAKAARLSGGSATSQEAGLYQFSQGIGSNQLGGDELRSVRENTLRLAKAIADGMGVSIAQLKKLGKEGKLDAITVANALDKSAKKIEDEYSKLPVTISSATTKLGNAFTDLINKSDQASGFASGFANVVNLLADNLGGLVSALSSVALAYAGFKTGNIISQTRQRIQTWTEERRAIMENANEAKASAATQRTASAERIVSLRQERAAIQQQIVAEQELANQKRQTALSLNSRLTRGSGFISGDAADVAAYRQAMDEARIAQDNLAASKNRLKNIGGELSQEFTVLTGATGRWRKAALAAESGARNMFRGLGAVLGALDPLALALSIGIPLLIEFAMRQDAAAGSADRMAKAQSDLARFVDETTGKITEQNAALIQNEILQAKKGAKDARDARLAAKQNLSFGGNSYTDIVTNISDLDPRVRAIRDQVRAGRLAAPVASQQLSGLKGLNSTSQEAVGKLIGQLADISKLAREELQGNAAARLLQGQNDPETRRQAFGNFTGKDAEVPKPTADNALAKARTKRKKATDEAAKAERELQRIQNLTDKRTDILSRYNDQSTALDRAAKDKRELGQMVGKMMEVRNAFGEAIKGPDGKPLTRLYTDEMANADKAAIDKGVRQPIRDAIDEQKQGLEISKLRLQGYNLEADQLERALQLQKTVGKVTAEDYATLVRNAREQERINDALASRERQVSQILDLANQTRDTFEEFIVSLRSDPAGALNKLGNSLIDNALRIEARQFSEKLFAGADAKLRELVSGSAGVDQATEILKGHVKAVADSVDPLKAANDDLASATELAAKRITAAANSISGGSSSVSGLAPSNTLDRVDEATKKATKAVTGASDIVQAAAGAAGGGIVAAATAAAQFAIGKGSTVSGLGQQAPNSTPGVSYASDGTMVIDVVGKRSAQQYDAGTIPTASQGYGQVFQRLGESLDKTFKSGSFFSGIGQGVGKALGGAAEGSFASGVLGMLGVKQSSTGAAIGGAIGSFIPFLGPVGGIVGGLVGGTLGGLFGKRPRGAAEVTNSSVYGHTNDTQLTSDITAQGNSLQDAIQQIADALGATVGSYDIGLGRYKEYYQVSSRAGDPALGNSYFWRNSSNSLYDGTDQQAAMQAAISGALSDGAIKGISQASKNILSHASDIQTAIQKAVAIENIPKLLEQRTDPVRYAVDQLNSEFSKLIGYLNEGGASAEQYAQAQKLYDMERADAIEQATNQASQALQSFLDEMKGGTSSPLNKRTVYQNAADQLNNFRGDINAGKVVDQNALLTAASNFQSASRDLNGSSSQFFADFNDLFDLLSKAKANITAGTSTDPLPASPFDAPNIQAIINSAADATNNQTDVLGSKLDQILGALGGNNGSGNNTPSAPSIGLLPGFAGQGRATYRNVVYA